MTVSTTTVMSDSIRSVYKSKYDLAQPPMRLYDQLSTDYTQIGADGKTMDELMQSDSIYIPFLGEMAPGTTAISETADVNPQTLDDTNTSITWTSRGEALQWSKKVDIQVYTDYAARAFEKVGQNAMLSIDLIAQEAALQGTFYKRAAGLSLRASLDAGESTHRASDSIFPQVEVMLMDMGAPGIVGNDGSNGTMMAIMHPFPFHDIRESGNIDSIGNYQDKGIHLNYELAQLGNTRLVVSRYAKVFGASGYANTTAVATTLNGAVSSLATSIVTAGDVSANIAKGLYWWIGTAESGNTHYATNERIKPLSATTVTVTALGAAANGGLKWDHATGATVSNRDSVYPILIGGPQSLVRVYATECGPYGEIIQPRKTGMLDQWTYAGWWWFGNYARLTEHRLMRWEVAVSYEA